MIRAAVLALTAAMLFCMWLDRPTPVKSVQVDYCMITYRAAAIDQRGDTHIIWTKGWGPCSQLDRYENA
jgi:hypothetical protein